MKKIMILTAVILLNLYSCSPKKETRLDNLLEANLIDTIKPKTNYRVHKEYDKNGNLISVDSTYSYFYSNTNIDPKQQEEILKQFEQEFRMRMPQIQNNIFDNLFNDNVPMDSIFKNNFYTPDFFYKYFNNNDLENMLKRMDSIKNRFYRAQINSRKKQV
ncbi:MAG: hypothetical protein L3J45_10525 [Flavobacteriaceae bacterium]|nr:hypothetical protein [Flavobacteriaceae bacterium]